MLVGNGFALSKPWFRKNYVWKGEIKVVYVPNSSTYYRVRDFENIYSEWLLRVDTLKAQIANSPIFSADFGEEFEVIEAEFNYYERELERCFSALGTEQRERLWRISDNLKKQYGLLHKPIYDSYDDVDRVMYFLKELPGRLRYTLLTLGAEKKPEIDEPTFATLQTIKSSFVEGKRYSKIEETGEPGLFSLISLELESRME